MKIWPRSKLARYEYKLVWNRASDTLEKAKRAVSGHVDEEVYRTSGENTRDLLAESVGLNSDDVVLEIGAGVGRVGATVAPRCKRWIGTDVSENMLKHARKRLANLNNVEFHSTNGFDLQKFANETVDLVYCTVVFMHLDEWERFSYIEEGFRILRPGGRMFVDNVDITSDEGWRFFESHRRVRPNDRPPHFSRTSTPDELTTYFRRAGFESPVTRRVDLWVHAWGRKPA